MVHVSRSLYTLLTMAAVLGMAASIACSRQPRYPAPPISGDEVVIDIASLPLEVPTFFTHFAGGRPVSFFVIRMHNGVHSYFDACVTCYPSKLGYAYQDGRVICRKCTMDFSIYKLEQGVGGCYPIKVKGRSEGGTYRIPVASIEAEAGKF